MLGEVADVVKRINYDMCMTLKVVGFDKDFIVCPDIVRGWMAPDVYIGDKHHNSFRVALRLSDAPRSHDDSLVQHSGHLHTEEDQITKVTAQLKKLWVAGPSVVQAVRNIWQRWRGQGSAAASSSGAQSLAETHGRVEGTASASSGGECSMVAAQWHAEIAKTGCQDSWAAVAGKGEAADILDTASDLLKQIVASDAGGGSVIEKAREEDCESEATNQSSQVSR